MVYIFFNETFKKICFFLFGIALLYFGIRLLHYHYLLITHPYPLEYREGSILLTTDLLLKGENPYALKNMPVAVNVYGIFYNLLVYPIAGIFGVNFLVHRAIAGFFIVFTCVLLLIALRRYMVDALYGISAALILYASLLYFITPLARPDGLGVFLFLLSILIVHIMEFSAWSMVISIFLGIIAFYTKPYFVLSIPLVTIYLFLFVTKKKGLFYGATAFAALASTAFIIDHLYETYFLNVIIIHLNSVNSDYKWLWKQIIYFWNMNYGLILAGFVFLCLSWLDTLLTAPWKNTGFKSVWGKLIEKVNILNVNKPLINADFPLSLYCLMVFSVVFYFKMGRHGGNWMTYAYQLVSPFLLLYIYVLFNMPLLNPRLDGFRRNWSYILIIPLVCLTLYSLFWSLPIGSRMKPSPDWEHVENIVLSHKNILNSPVVVSFLVEQNKQVYDSGQTMYFIDAKHSFRWLDTWVPTNSEIRDIQKNYTNSLMVEIQSKKFDVIMIDDKIQASYLKDLPTFYFLSETIKVCMFHTEQYINLGVWYPK